VAEVATSLLEERGHRVPRALFTAALLTRLEEWLDVHQERGFDAIREAWRSMSNTLGQEVLVKTERREFTGIAEDIDEIGALLVRTPTGLERVVAGDVEQLRTRKKPLS
jgi:BirA family biotin operon repressor/biotin-[acetyl-CoA-carboxylase] ligase